MTAPGQPSIQWMLKLLVGLVLVLPFTGCKAIAGTDSGLELTADVIAAMVLALEDFGPEYASAAVDPDSGAKTREQIVAEAGEPADEAADVAEYGHLLRYVRTFTSGEAIVRGTGAVYLGSSVTAYRDGKGALGDLRDQLSDLQRNLSGTSDLGSLLSFKTFEAAAGEEGYGVTARVLTGGATFGRKGMITLTITAVAFQRERLVGEVVIMRLDGRDVQAEARELARRLDVRVMTVLGGGVQEPPAASQPLGSGPAPPQNPR